MKKLIATIMFIMVATTTQAQFSNDLVNAYAQQVIDGVEGYQQQAGTNNDMEFILIALPDYMDFDLLRMVVNGITSRHRDITLARAWTREDDGSYNYFVLLNNEIQVAVVYFPDTKHLVLGF